ncbi:MAG: GNAT family N-acetyltransferase [Candidatus Latescibacteria bacterium]|nr:GNAT family N-acetyltransferase [Candidatus Latescibacterota bacterium]
MLETDRLRLRELSIEDFGALHPVLSDPIAMKHYDKPFDREMTRGWIDWSLRNYAKHGFGLWAVLLKSEDRLIGDCGLTIQRVDGVDELEIGYHILRSRWGQGYATEAARACRDHVFDRLGRDRVISKLRTSNIASRRVAEKVGMKLEKETVGKSGKLSLVYSMTPADRLG